jgi:hypothetical protein
MPAHNPDNGDLSARLDYPSIAGYEESHPDMDGESIGRALTARATKAQLRAYAVEEVRGIVESLRRARARAAENRAVRERPQVPEPAPDPEEERRREAEIDRVIEQLNEYQAINEARRRAARAAHYEQMLADPRLLTPLPRNWPRYQEWHRAEFREWAGDRFPAWREQARAVAVDDWGWDERDFDAFWHPGGERAYWSERNRRLMDEAVEEWAARIRLETTRELLGTLFALGDGIETTWGAATVDQHEQRIEMLTKNAAGLTETAARHQAAVRMIKDAGVSCLADLAGPDDDGLAPVAAVAP